MTRVKGGLIYTINKIPKFTGNAFAATEEPKPRIPIW
jgi:hypothetical protein